MPKKLELKTIFKGVDRMTRPISRIQRRIKRFSNRAVKSMKRIRAATRAVAGAMGRVLKRGIQGATVALVALGAAAAKVIQIGAGFEKTLVSAAVKFPGKIRQGSEAFRELEDTARKAGAETEFTATQAAEGLNFLAMAGFNADQAIAALPGVIDLATASAVELSEASDMATDTLGAFGLMTDKTEQLGLNLARVNDVMAATTTSANTNMEQMFEAIKGGGPVVHAAGQSIETYASLVGTMADSGVKGEKAGVMLKNMFLRLQAPVGAAKGMIKKYAGNILDAKGDMIDIVEIMRRFEKSTGKLGKAQRAQIMNTIFGKRAIVGTSVLLEAGADKMDEYRDSIKAASGTSKEMAGVIRNTTGGSIDALKSVIESLIIDLFKLEDKGIKGVIDGMVKWIRENKKLIASKVGAFIKDLIKKFKEFRKWAKDVQLIEKLKDGFGLLAKVIGFVVENIKPLSVLAGVVLAIAAAVEVLTAVTAIMNFVAMANPMVLMFMAVAAISAFTVGAIIMNWDDIKYFFEEIGRFLMRIFKATWEAVLYIFDSNIGKIVFGPIHLLIEAAKILRDAWDPNKGFFENLWNGIVNIFTKAWEKIKQIAGDVGSFYKDLFGFGDEPRAVKPPKLRVLEGGRSDLDLPKDQSSMSIDPQMVSPFERTARSIEDRSLTTTQKTEVTLKDETGRAEITEGSEGGGFSMAPTGSF